MSISSSISNKRSWYSHPAWVLIAAFGTYFCMYGFRKPYTAAMYAKISYFGFDFKFLLVIAQTLGYVISKWLGIKVVSEVKPTQKIRMIIGLLTWAEAMLLLFGIISRPWNVLCLFLNGLSLGIIYGLVLGFLEGRKSTEALIAGLCTSFIVADGFSKSVGKFLLDQGVSEAWMPFVAGLIFLIPACIFLTMLSRVSAPNDADLRSRSKREPMKAVDRWKFYSKYAPGLTAIAIIYLFVSLLRSVRADFAPELWTSLGYHQSPSLFTQTELLVSFGVIVANGLAVLILNHNKAFRFSLFICLTGFLILILATAGLKEGIGQFFFMILIGLGVYLPYVAIHTIVFERFIAITREKANIGFLMYFVDSVGYGGYVVLMIFRNRNPSDSILSLFLNMASYLGIMGVILVFFCVGYFRIKFRNNERNIEGFSFGKSSHI